MTKLMLDIAKETYVAAFNYNLNEGFKSLDELANLLKIGSKSEAMTLITEAWSNEEDLLDQLEFIDSSTEIVDITDEDEESSEEY